MGDSNDSKEMTRAFVRVPPRDSNFSGHSSSMTTGSSHAWSMPPAPKLVPRISACPGCCRVGAAVAIGSCPTLCSDCISMLQPKYFYKVNQYRVPVESEAAQASFAPMSGPGSQQVPYADHKCRAPTQGYHHLANQNYGAPLYYMRKDMNQSSGNVSARMSGIPADEHLPYGPSAGGQSGNYREVYPVGAIPGSSPYYAAQVYDDMRLWPPQPAACDPRVGRAYQYHPPTSFIHNIQQDHMRM
mmetsp:Transcript_43598/g.95364  ORF Transcript_43598/g.95364 Transcript_43598/m.95364 type:complete len:243 (+) Transcript_43598:137-865(+)